MNEDILELVYLLMRQAVEDAEADLKAVMDEIRARNERLQMALDRRSKFEEALSNLLKKQSDTAAAIIGNLK